MHLTNKQQIINLLEKVERPGMPELINYLEESNFYKVPASLKYHQNFTGGLATHSLEVMKMFVKRNRMMANPMPEESAIVCGLLHDIRKVLTYKWNGEEWVYNDADRDKRHGVLSVEMIEKFIKLTEEEREVIKCHMLLFSIFSYANEITVEELYNAIKVYPSVHVFSSCDNENAHWKEV
jgi:putative nucleotidyltransferase with HDIG domain